MPGLGFALFAVAVRASDPFQWLEEVEGERAMAWVRAQNARTSEALGSSEAFEALQAKLLAIMDSDDRIPYLSKLGERYVNFWRDDEHPRGVWRSTTLAAYRSGAPAWQTLLDLDALADEEGENWVWKGASCLAPRRERCLLHLSRGGADASVVREFDVVTASFVEAGFVLEEAKSRVSWIDADNLYVGTDFGEGSLTNSGYPRIVKRWTRGTPLSQARTVFEGTAHDVSVMAYTERQPGFERDFVVRAPSYYTTEVFEVTPRGLVRVAKPPSARFDSHGRYAFLQLRDDLTHRGKTYAAGSLLVTDHRRLIEGKPRYTVLFEPTKSTSLRGWGVTKSRVFLQLLDDVKTTTVALTPGRRRWTREWFGGEGLDNTSVSAVDPHTSDDVFVYRSGFLTPASYGLGNLLTGQVRPLDQLPALFDAEGLEVVQRFATSKDGTQVPYFLVAPTVRGTEPVPTLMSGYGGFESSQLPFYSGGLGQAWLERGGAYVVANIRGGGEYGPAWHRAALRENRHRAYEDFAAVGRDLVSRGLTTSDRLAILGGSNGGLLVGNVYTTYPELWGAVVCQVPLLDMKRYTKLLAGASWIGEYGDPDDEDDWAFLKAYSPYHNLDPAEENAPPILITTSTRDDRVHPGHARKFVAALEATGRNDVWYYENIEGGHGGAANNAQRAYLWALAYSFAWARLTSER